MTREAELQTEIAIVEDALSAMSGSDFATQITRVPMERRLANLRSDLQAIADRVLTVRLVQRANPESHGLSTSLLGALLGRMQSTVTYGTWAMSAGPSVTGNVPASVERSAETEVVATPPGSFQVRLRKSQLDLTDDFDRSIEIIVDIIAAAAEDSLTDEVGEKAQALGKEATRRMELWFKKMAEERLDSEFGWHSPTSYRHHYVSSEMAGALSGWLADVIPAIEVFDVIGYLRRADTLNGAFKIEELGTGELFEGSGDREELSHVETDALFAARIERTTRTTARTGRVTRRDRLLGLTPTSADEASAKDVSRPQLDQ